MVSSSDSAPVIALNGYKFCCKFVFLVFDNEKVRRTEIIKNKDVLVNSDKSEAYWRFSNIFRMATKLLDINSQKITKSNIGIVFYIAIANAKFLIR